jgi:hypothetical protein
MLIKNLDSRQMEAYLAENVVARVFIGRHHDTHAQIRDHSNIARAYAALGKAGIEEVTQLVIKQAHGFGFVDEGVMSSDTTAQELPIATCLRISMKGKVASSSPPSGVRDVAQQGKKLSRFSSVWWARYGVSGLRFYF